MSRILRLHAAVILVDLSMAALVAQPIDRAELEALRAQVRQLETQVKVLVQRLEAAEPAGLRTEPAAAAAPGEISVTDRGYAVASGDGANSLRLRSLLQFDTRSFFDNDGISNDTFMLRRARLIAEGTLARDFGYRFVTEFGGGSVTILDANLTAQLTRAVLLRAGKFKAPVGHELLQRTAATSFTERSLATRLVPNRDVGVQLSGDILDRRLSYAVGIFNGTADATNSTNSDFDEKKDAIGRIVLRPFAGRADSSLTGLSLGFGGSHGNRHTTAGRPEGYRTDGQQLFFRYAPGVIADGRAWRLAPHVDYRVGPLGLLGEYVVSSATLRPVAMEPRTELQHRGWHVTAGYVLTGEASSYTGIVPRENFSLAAGTWGAFEVLGRVSGLDIDDAAFPRFASASASATEVKSLALGLNWHLSKAVRFMFDYYQTAFDGDGVTLSAPVLRQDEKVFLSRFQFAF